jgi:hypothetical protein
MYEPLGIGSKSCSELQSGDIGPLLIGPVVVVSPQGESRLPRHYCSNWWNGNREMMVVLKWGW